MPRGEQTGDRLTHEGGPGHFFSLGHGCQFCELVVWNIHECAHGAYISI